MEARPTTGTGGGLSTALAILCAYSLAMAGLFVFAGRFDDVKSPAGTGGEPWWHIEPSYDVVATRTFADAAGQEAINATEALDFAGILGTQRYRDWEALTDEPPASATAYVWANVLDRNVSDFYLAKVAQLAEGGVEVDASFNYTVECIQMSSFNVSYLASDFHNTTIDSEAYYGFPLRAILSGGSLSPIDNATGNISIPLQSGFLVRQTFAYSEAYGPRAAFFSYVEQITVLDAGLSPVLVLSMSSAAVS